MELEEIEAKFRAELKKGSPLAEWYNMFFAPRMAYRIALGMGLQMLQQLTGANYFFYYGTVIFQATGINNSFVTQMILNGINFGTTFYGLYIVEHYGRRKSLIWGSTWMFICFMIFASVGHFSLDREHPANTPKSGVAMICFASFFIFGVSADQHQQMLFRSTLTWPTVRNNVGPNDLDYRWRVISISLSRQGHGLVHRVELVLEFLVGILHSIHHWRH
jgi:hypothetical protein